MNNYMIVSCLIFSITKCMNLTHQQQQDLNEINEILRAIDELTEQNRSNLISDYHSLVNDSWYYPDTKIRLRQGYKLYLNPMQQIEINRHTHVIEYLPMPLRNSIDLQTPYGTFQIGDVRFTSLNQLLAYKSFLGTTFASEFTNNREMVLKKFKDNQLPDIIEGGAQDQHLLPTIRECQDFLANGTRPIITQLTLNPAHPLILP